MAAQKSISGEEKVEEDKVSVDYRDDFNFPN